MVRLVVPDQSGRPANVQYDGILAVEGRRGHRHTGLVRPVCDRLEVRGCTGDRLFADHVHAAFDCGVDDGRRLVVSVRDPGDVDVAVPEQLDGVLVDCRVGDERRDVVTLGRDLVGSLVHRGDVRRIDGPTGFTQCGDVHAESAGDREVRVPVVVIEPDIADVRWHMQ